ncbi:polysaccharide deacetylase family protein [Oceanobacillus chungangensis]|uniref:Chitooligosaccharide deacetylase n=1 Tax=Oceanobacillus chungangensis TaxID=1229152 RepID=A0A3D8PXB5_9BACI|nr:polysaccharide deacetylase family protein [Oceanobacillus chungangensis]RDW19951.1 chitooligosaccharide deacetylase [Oceanobacillus chungangensis]
MKRRLFFLFLFFLLFFTNTQTSATDRWDYEKTGHVTWDIDTKEKMVAITFDDGPHPQYTPDILDVLAKYDAKATFFVLGAHAKKYSGLIYRQFTEGHEIANHTYNHNYHPISSKELKKEIDDTAKIIYEITGTKPTLFRPVGGAYNDLIINTAVDSGYHVVLWSWHQDPEDWKNPSVNRITNHILSNISPGDIILLHDAGGDRSRTITSLEKILPILEKKGYKFVTVSEMMLRNEMKDSSFFNLFLK